MRPIEDDDNLTARVAALEETQAAILAELRAMQRGRRIVTPEQVVTLLEHLADACGEEWTVGEVFEIALDHPSLRGAIVACIGRKPTLQRFSRFLSRHCGTWGTVRLLCLNRHSREGALFTVMQCVTSSQSGCATVLSTGGQ